MATNRTGRFAVTQSLNRANRKRAWAFPEQVLAAVPRRTSTILTDHGIQFAGQPRQRNIVASRQIRVDMICTADDTEQRLTRPNLPLIDGQSSA